MSLKQEIRRGILASFIGKYAHVLIQIVVLAIMARLLSPEEFGIVAVVMVFVTFFNMLSEMGIGPSIIQNKELTDQDVHSIFTLTFFIALVLAGFFVLFSYPISLFYDNPVYIKIGRLLSLAIFFSTLNIVPTAILRKNKFFRQQAVILFLSSVFSGGIALLLAYWNFGYYAIIWRTNIYSMLTFVCTYFFSRYRYSPFFRRDSLKKIAGYSVYQFAFDFTMHFSRNSDNILISKFLGETALGYYDKAYTLMLYPIRYLSGVVSQTLHPFFSEIQDDGKRIYASYLKLVRILAVLGMLISVFCFFGAREMILIFFGPQWTSTIPVFRILSITIFFQMILSSSGAVFQSVGRTDLLFLTGIISSVIILCSVLSGVLMNSIENVAYGLVFSYVSIFFIVYYIQVKKTFRVSFLSFLRCLDLSCIIGGALICSLFGFTYVQVESIWLSLLMKGLITLAVSGLVIFLTGTSRELREYFL